MLTLIIALVFLIIGFIGGIIVGRRNKKKEIDFIIKKTEEEYQSYKECRG